MQASHQLKRLELQFGHINDMIKEQNRMVLAEVEPTNSEREDMLILLSEIKASLETCPRPNVAKFSSSYEYVLKELGELNYNTTSYALVSSESAPSSKPDEGGSTQRLKKQVHFEDNEYADSEIQSPFSDSGDISERSSFNNDFTSTQIYDQNDLLMEYQDRRLEEIGSSVGRQRAMGESINSELGLHNNMLEDVEAQVDRSQGRLDRLTNGVKSFNRKSRECGTCSIILGLVLLLFIVIIL